MRLADINAIAHPGGNRITLKWTNPDPAGYPGIRVVRREDTYPVSPQDGFVVADGSALHYAVNTAGEALYRLSDGNLKGETHYYYGLFPYSGDPPVYVEDSHNRCQAMATAPYDFAGLMYGLLPRIYHRYDTATPPAPAATVPDRLKEAGQLRRYLELPGSVLDQLYSHARASFHLHNPDRADGRLLPLLAQWIGWQIDYRLEIDAQRNEVRNAPHLYKTVGLIPTVEATVKRLTNWESRIKEFVHNIFFANDPEKLTIWQMRETAPGEWQDARDPLSLSVAFEGRPSAVHAADGSVLLFFHSLKKERWDIWEKIYTPAEGWGPSRPLTDGADIDKHPVAVIQSGRIWLFWASYSTKKDLWRIRFRRRNPAGEWSAAAVFGDDLTSRRAPAATVDTAGGLWLFWLERTGSRWQLRYNRHDGVGWQLDPAAVFPDDAGHDPRLESEPFAISFQSGSAHRLALFWARREAAGGPDSKRWSLVSRVKADNDPAVTADWGPVRVKAKDSPLTNDNDPAARVVAGSQLEVFWSSDGAGSRSIFRVDYDVETDSWGTDEQVTNSPYTERYPCPIVIDSERRVLLRSNHHLLYTSEVYKATETMDMRYAGSVSAVSANIARNSLHGTFKDFQSYTYDVGAGGAMTDRNWYSRETMGIYLTPDTEDPHLISRNQKLLRGVLHQFIPIQVRYVFVIEPAVYQEKVYTYDFPLDENERVIGEEYADSLTAAGEEVYAGPSDGHVDRIPEWRWLKAWSLGESGGGSVGTGDPPANREFRTWHVGVQSGGEE